MAAASRGLIDFDVILDTRQSQATLTIADLWHLAVYLVSPPELRGRKIAILPPAEAFDRAAFFALVAQNRGVHVRAFASFAEVIDWLAEDRTSLLQ